MPPFVPQTDLLLVPAVSPLVSLLLLAPFRSLSPHLSLHLFTNLRCSPCLCLVTRTWSRLVSLLVSLLVSPLASPFFALLAFAHSNLVTGLSPPVCRTTCRHTLLVSLRVVGDRSFISWRAPFVSDDTYLGFWYLMIGEHSCD